jgi:hypothetical protein
MDKGDVISFKTVFQHTRISSISIRKKKTKKQKPGGRRQVNDIGIFSKEKRKTQV